VGTEDTLLTKFLHYTRWYTSSDLANAIFLGLPRLCALPIINNKSLNTPLKIQLKLSKRQRRQIS